MDLRLAVVQTILVFGNMFFSSGFIDVQFFLM